MTIEHYIAYQTPMGNWPVQESRRCLVIDFESDDYLIYDRSFAVTPVLASDTPEEIPADAPSIRYMQDDQGYFGIAGTTPDARLALLESELRDAYEAGDPYSYVRIDTLKMFIGPAPRYFSGNIYDWENLWTTRLNRLAQTWGCAIVAMHHTNKAGESSGSTGIAGGVTSMIKMSRNDEAKHEIILESTKTRASQPFRSVLIQNPDGKPEFTDTLTVTQAELVGLSRQIADLLYQRGPQTLRGILGAFYTFKKETIKSALNRMSGKGRVISKLGRWQLVDQPEHLPQPQEVPSGPRACSVCDLPIVPLEDPLQMAHTACEHPAKVEGLQEDQDEQEEPGQWSAFAALKDSIGSSRMHPVRFIAAAARDRGAWPLFTGDDNAAGERMTGEHRWTSAQHIPDAFTQVGVLDRNGSYPAACSSVTVSPAILRHTGDRPDLRDGGIFLINPVPWTDERIGHPLGTIADQPGPWWISAPHMALLRRLQIPVTVLDSWTGKPVGNLFEPFSRTVRAERALAWARGPADYGRVKRSSSIALRSLWSSTRSPFWRPDWSVAIRAEAAVRHWAVAYRAVLAGEVLLQLGNVDEIVFLMPPAATDATWVPAGYEMHPIDYGRVKHKDSVAIAKGIKVPSPITLEQFRIRAGL